MTLPLASRRGPTLANLEAAVPAEPRTGFISEERFGGLFEARGGCVPVGRGQHGIHLINFRRTRFSKAVYLSRCTRQTHLRLVLKPIFAVGENTKTQKQNYPHRRTGPLAALVGPEKHPVKHLGRRFPPMASGRCRWHLHYFAFHDASGRCLCPTRSAIRLLAGPQDCA